MKDVEFHLRQSVNEQPKCANIETFKAFNRISIVSHDPFYGPMQSTLFNILKYLFGQVENNQVIKSRLKSWRDPCEMMKISA